VGNILRGLTQGFESFATNKPLGGIQDRDEARRLQQSLGQTGDITSPEFQQLSALAPVQASKIGSLFGNIGIKRETELFQDAEKVLRKLKSGDIDGASDLLADRVERLQKINADPSQSLDVARDIVSGNIPKAISDLQFTVQTGIKQGLLTDPEEQRLKREDRKSAGQREFNDLLRIAQDPNSTEIEKNAALRKLGGKARVSTSAIERIAEDPDLAIKIAKTQAEIEEGKTFGKLTGSSRAKAIDSGIKRIETIDLGIRNIDKAIELVAKGAGVGVINSQLPSIRAASIALDFIQKKMSLDVIGAVTFGALSKGELDLAKEVALPTGLNSEELTQHLIDRKNAQLKLRGYFNDQIQFLDQGGTIAGFLRQKEREQGSEQPVIQETTTTTIQPQPTQQQAGQQVQEGATATNPQTGEKLIFRNGQWVPFNG